ncbi:hypothetical protein [Evansella cellulosilytica]|uniref:Uncharacterized protein n=1 Tax=Evansella cellulosilytica (strain ATCC 21833 / DSM 2522 / FERM P-1141 / JCM 9156 / N-4) TaxID=649639 RepID=E6TQE3_EVAC2|nr:hypothetical protein [Evansella cellulosilytica]ADU29321.1 hypothetical protein Bcell_1048 [Evansella cellulosilytica DSM 2522]
MRNFWQTRTVPVRILPVYFQIARNLVEIARYLVEIARNLAEIARNFEKIVQNKQYGGKREPSPLVLSPFVLALWVVDAAVVVIWATAP